MRNLLPKEWRLISDLNAHAFMNMAIDEAIAKSSAESKPTIRFYTWGKPAVSVGYFQRIMPVIDWLNHNLSQELKVKKVSYHSPYSTSDSRLSTQDSQRSTPIDIVRRPTGGGVILHSPVLSEANVTDITYSVAMRLPRGFAPRNDTPTHNSIPFFYRQMGQAVIKGMSLLGITAEFCTQSRLSTQDARLMTPLSLCAQTPMEFDVLVIPPVPPFNKGGKGGIKVAGCAARRFQEGLLLQGYISIGQFADMTLQHVLNAMVKGFALALNIELVKGTLTEEEFTLAEELNDKKYSRKEWNYKR